MEISHVSPPETRYFWPLRDTSRIHICSDLGIQQKCLQKGLKFYSVGSVLNEAPLEKYECKGDGNCFFNAVSLIVSGSEAYHKNVRKAVCDFIENNAKELDPFLRKGEGKEYLKRTNMRQNKTWASAIEILAVAKISHRDVYVYKSPGPGSGWLRYGYSEQKSSDAFYMTNIGNVHFEVVKRP